MSFHWLTKSRDKNFFSVRVSSDLRLIVHRTKDSLLLCYVGHHDAAYAWAERRVLNVHPRTGAAQLVEIRETVREIETPAYPMATAPLAPAPAPPTSTRATSLPLFAGLTDEDLLEYGVPAEWLAHVRQATEDTLLDLVDHLPGEAAEALLQLATGGRPEKSVQAAPESDPFEHPDAQRRFRLIDDSEELAVALESPWERWTIFLHPTQRNLVSRRYNGPFRVSGSAGTGKTVVAIHRAAHLARSEPEANVLLTTFNPILASVLRTKLARLLGADNPALGSHRRQRHGRGRPEAVRGRVRSTARARRRYHPRTAP